MHNYQEQDLKELSTFVARDFKESAINLRSITSELPTGATWLAVYQVNAMIVALVSKDEVSRANDYHKRFGTPFPGLIASNFGDNVAVNALDGVHYYSGSNSNNFFALNILFGASVILENYSHKMAIRNSVGNIETINYKIPIAFVMGTGAGGNIENIRGHLKGLIATYFKVKKSKV